VYRSLKSALASSRKKFREYQLPTRRNVANEPIPILFIFSFPQGLEREEIVEAIRRMPLDNLISYEDICVSNGGCRFFSFEVSDQPYFSVSQPIYSRLKRRQGFYGKLYITKECALRVIGFRRIVKTCPFKATSELTFEK
jgi:hypothetical protein